MPSKKRSKESKVVKKDFSEEEEGLDLLEEDDEEEEVEYELADDAEAKIEEILSTGVVPAFINPEREQKTDDYPTDTHLRCKVKHTEGDIAPPFAETLIIRKP